MEARNDRERYGRCEGLPGEESPRKGPHAQASRPGRISRSFSRSPCVFFHFGVDNVRDKTIREAVRKAIANHVAQSGHAHSEDIVRDARVVDWVDRWRDGRVIGMPGR